MKRIASPVSEIKSDYDVVVIGSGYGGSIAASRLARSGKKVCLLERGKELLPGEYPDTLLSAQREFQINTSEKRIGSQTGLFDLHIYKDMQILVGCGLGGTSLINANVSIKPELRIFEDERWPEILRQEFKDEQSLLNLSYEKAKFMLKPTPFPDQVQLNKLNALQDAAKAIDEKMYRTHINVNFDIDGNNHVGVPQKPCNNCGDCCSGCNYSAKNTLLMNYLPDARNNGAEIYCECKVSHIEKVNGEYHVHFSPLGKGVEKFDAPTAFVKAGMVVVAAGTLGSTEIMLRSKANGLRISDRVGEQYSGNGDVLAFGYNTNKDINGIGAGNTKVYEKRPIGPCITGVIDAREKPNLDDGMIIEDAAIPGALAKILSGSMAILDGVIGDRFSKDKSLNYKFQQLWRKWVSLLRGAYHGALRNTQTYLVMSTDSGKGQLKLEDDRLNLSFPGVGDEPIYKLVDEKLKKAARAAKGDYIRNPIWSKQFGNDLITVHPLGGCAMGEDFDRGVVNHKGQVFSPEGVHEGLYVLDGSIIPRAVGVNPLITISAVAERACTLMAKDYGWEMDEAFRNQLGNVGVEDRIGIEFTETMKGYFAFGSSGNFEEAYEKGENEGNKIKFTLTIISSDVYDMIQNPNHTAQMMGTVIAPALSKEPLSVLNGTFNLFVDDPNNVNTRLMKYTMVLHAEDGQKYHFYGYKQVYNDKHKLDLWPDNSTLFTTIRKGESPDAEILGQGILKIKMLDFARQMTTLKPVNAHSVHEGLKAVADFGKFFSGALFDVYGRALVPDRFFNAQAKPRERRPLRTELPEVYPLKTEDGQNLILTRYNGGSKGPLMMLHGFSGNRYTFSIDTIDTNAVEYFYEQGYDVWLLDYRLSSLVDGAKHQQTIDDVALYDLPAAVDKIIKIADVAQIDVLAHCVGSISMFMSLMSGKLTNKIRSMVSAQIAIDFHPRMEVEFKTGLHLPQFLDDMGITTLSAYTDSSAKWEEKLYNEFIKLYADHRAEFCTDPSCQRMCFMFGPLVEHAQMNEKTHDATIEMFGTANITGFKQLALMIRQNKVLNAKGEDTYIGGVSHLQLPITFICGSNNGLFEVASTRSTYENLCRINGSEYYQHHVIRGYGHNDCMYGKNADKDVYPIILRHLESVNGRATSIG